MTEPAHIDEEMLRELMRSISHDLRNPLAAVVTNLAFSRGLVDDLTAGDTSAAEDLTEAVDDSVIACDVMQMIVANLDIVLRADASRATLHRVTVPAVVEDVVKRFATRAAQAEVRLVYRDTSNAAQAMLDRTYFALAVENALANAVTHTPKGTRVTVEVIGTSQGTQVHFTDEGLVIPVALREAAVSARAHTRAGKVEETRYSRGLGLLSAARAARAAGAELQLSEYEGRNRFTLNIVNEAPRTLPPGPL